MLQTIDFIFILLAGFISVAMILFIVYSISEKQKRAVKRGVFCLFLFGVIASGTWFLPEAIKLVVLFAPVLLLAIVLPRYGNRTINFAIPKKQFDERDVMFSRNTLKEGTKKFNDYYKLRPEHKAADDSFRKEPGLLKKGSVYYNELLFSAANSTFQTVDLLQPLVEGEANATKTNLREKDISDFVKQWTIKLGALDIGFTELKRHHIYSHVGRGATYGNQVELNHKYAIAFTVEMSHEFLSNNPKGPVVMESAQQYLNAGQIAVQLAQFLRNLGFDARAHIDANYRLICPIVAQDAGLGVIGRMGLLMTPDLGPRVRIGVVSTNLALPINKRLPDSSVIHFCEVCKKCANNCPSQAIPLTSVKSDKQAKRWTINQEKCFTYWCKVGTDCGRCVAVCPYSHPNNFMHNIVRRLIARNPINRYLALKLDDFFYGAKPKSQKLRIWMLAQKN